MGAYIHAPISTYLQITRTGTKRLVVPVNVRVHNGLVHTTARTYQKKTILSIDSGTSYILSSVHVYVYVT